MIEVRKLITTRETVFSELGVEANRPATRAVGMAVIRNPFARQLGGEIKYCRKARSRPATGATAPIRSRPGASGNIGRTRPAVATC